MTNPVHSGLVTTVAGTLTKTVHSSARLIDVRHVRIVNTVVGRGGINVRIIDNFVITGKLITRTDILMCCVMANVTGISKIKLILKNSGNLIRNVTYITV